MKIVIAGVGFVGLAAARLLRDAGHDVIGLTRSPGSSGPLPGISAATCDISDAASVAALGVRDADVVIHCASSSRGGADEYRAVYFDGTRNLIEILAPRRFVFTSSTSVYAQTDGSLVTEESTAKPDRETGRILRGTEELVLAWGGAVARLAGIYGPGRSVLLRKFFSGEAVIEGNGTRFINQIHRDDAATALALLADRGVSGIYNVADDAQPTQRELYAWLAARFGKPLPPSGPAEPNRKRGSTNKRVSNSKLRALGWQPMWPTFFDAVAGDPTLVALAK
jgi:nucleoside-diphosphate-sugar epimerase